MNRRTFLANSGFTLFGLFNIQPAKIKQTQTYIELGAGEHTTPIDMSSNIRAVYGQGEGVTIFSVPNGQTGIRRSWAGSGYESEFTVEGMTINGQGTLSEGISIAGNSVLNRVNKIRIRNVSFSNLLRGLRLRYGVNVIISDCYAIACGRGNDLFETADIRLANCSTQLCSEYGTLLAGQTLPYNEGFSAVGLVDNGSKTGLRVNEYDFVWLSACSFSSAEANAVIIHNSDEFRWTGGEASNTRPGSSGAGVLISGNSQRAMLHGLTIDNCTGYGMYLQGTRHVVSDCNFVNNKNVDLGLEATRCRIHDNDFQSAGVAWSLVESGGANYNRVHDNEPAGAMVKIGAQSKFHDN